MWISNAVAQLADMLVERGFEPAIAQPATAQPLRRKSIHFLQNRPRINIGRPEQFERPRGAAAPSESVAPSTITVPA